MLNERTVSRSAFSTQRSELPTALRSDVCKAEPRVGLFPGALVGEALHELILTLLHLFWRQILFASRDRPPVAGWIGKRAASIAPELIGDPAHRSLCDL